MGGPVKTLGDQWALHLLTLNRDWEARFNTFDRHWRDLGGSLQSQLGGLRQNINSRVKTHFGEAIQAQLEVASAVHDESIAALRCNLMEYIDATVQREVLDQVQNVESSCPCQIHGQCPCVRRETEPRTPRRSKRSV